jgi:hypothetical protein
MRTYLGLSCLVLTAACGDDPVSYSAPVGINLKAKSSDVVNDVVTDEKGITTESGNPYGAFVGDAQATLGRDPGSIEIDSVELLLGGNSTGVTTLGEIFAGNTEVLFIMNDTDNTFPAASGTIDADTDGGPVELDVDFEPPATTAEDWDKLINGSFKVVIRGDAAAEFTTKGADADVQVTFTFSAYE